MKTMRLLKILKITLSVFIIALILIYFHRLYSDRQEALNENYCFVIVQINSIEYGSRTAPVYLYDLYFNNKIYKGVFSLAGNKLRESTKTERNSLIGNNYLAKVSRVKPKFNELLIDKHVPDSLVECCKYYVWNKPPF